MLAKVLSAALSGINSVMITVEVNTARGALFFLVGSPDNSIKESHERIVSAMQNSGYAFPTANITINLTPASLRKVGAAYDLPIAIGIMAASENVKPDKLGTTLMVGELSLDGSLLPVPGALPIAIMAREAGVESIIVPAQNADEAAVVNRVKVYGAKNLREVVDLLNNAPGAIEPTFFDTRADFAAHQYTYPYDFADVKGQFEAKRALEVAAAGGHNILLIGPPGSGKSMLAKRLPSILPPLTLEESLETTKIHSVAGKLIGGHGLVKERPFQSPHHTVSQVALVGGGQSAMPGEISLAHNGVLYCDELPEFPRNVLEVLRQPLEDRVIHVSRANYSVVFPASFMFCASMNPCPCGYFGDPTHKCECSQGAVSRYLNKISGPLLDRIDIHLSVLPLKFDELTDNTPTECSRQVRQRVVAARERQEERFADYPSIHCNAQMEGSLLQEFTELTPTNMELLRSAMQRQGLSARAFDRVKKLARTIADLADSDTIEREHLIEAISYRNLDRNTGLGFS